MLTVSLPRETSMKALTRILLGLCLFGLALVAKAEPALLLAEVYRSELDPADYLVSEKLDGIRAIWDGRTLRFRSGNEVKAPAWFLAGLPKRQLDGELWAGRGRFEHLSSVVRKEVPMDEEWREVRYMLFELPDVPGSFENRAEGMRQLVRETGTPWLQAIEQFRVPDRESLKIKLNEIVRAGGEGLMLHKADAPYLTGRSEVLLKLKPYLDAEARVLAHLPGKGRHDGRLGALLVETPDGRRFRLGTGFSDAERDAPPPVGTTVTYRYRALSAKGLPRFASFLRIRQDP